MAARRLNIKFLIILFSVTLGLLLLGRIMWGINTTRMASSFYERGVMAQKKGDMDLALAEFSKFRRSKNTDKEKMNDVLIRMTEIYTTRLDKIAPKQMEYVLSIMNQALQVDVSNRDLKKRVALAYQKKGESSHAARLFLDLAKEDPKNPEFLLHAAECQIASNQGADAEITLGKLIETHPSYIPGYIQFAKLREMQQGNSEEVEAILDTMVESNNQSAAAYARRAIYRCTKQKLVEAMNDYVSACELDNTVLDTKLAGINIYIAKKEFAEAHKLLAEAEVLDKDAPEVATLQVRLADAENKPEEAIKAIRAQIAKKDDILLRLQLFERLVAYKKLDEARNEIAFLKTRGFSLEALGFFESIIDMIENNWGDARRKLEAAKGIMANQPEMLAYIYRQLAICYGELGQIHKQIDALQNAIEMATLEDSVPLQISYILALHKAGRTPQLTDAVNRLLAQIKKEEFMKIPQMRNIYITLKAQEKTANSKEEQSWDSIQKILNEANLNPDDPESIILGAQMLVKQGKIDDARKVLTDAIEKQQKKTGFISLLALLETQEGDPKKGLKILEEALKKGGRVPGLLVTKARVVAQLGAENATPILMQMDDDLKKDPRPIQELLLPRYAAAWTHLGNIDRARMEYEQLAVIQPENIGTKIQLFDLARKANDENTMERQMAAIRLAVGENSAEYKYCQATQLIWLFQQKKATKSRLQEAKSFLDTASKLQANWANVPRAQAEIALLESDFSDAINYLYRVEQLGALTPQQLDLMVRLLYREGRDDDVRQLLANKRGIQLTGDSAIMSIESMANAGEGEEALKRASEIVNVNSPGDFLWKGRIALLAKNYTEAEIAFRRVTNLDPKNSTGWLALLRTLKIQNRDIEAAQVIEQMQAALPREKLPLALAKSRQLMGDAQAAEKAYLEAVAVAPDDLETLFAISNFYMRTTRPELSEPRLQRMIELLVTDEKLDQRLKVQQLSWARRSLAQVYALHASYNYQQKAIQLIDENLKMDSGNTEDIKAKAFILATRQNPRDNRYALELLQGIQNLQPQERFLLAKLYETLGVQNDSREMWKRCRAIMIDLCADQDVVTAEYLSTFVDMLLRRRQPTAEIRPYLDRYDAKVPDSPLGISLRARMMMQDNNREGAQQMLITLVPETITDANEGKTLEIAELLERINAVDAAQRVLEKMHTQRKLGTLRYAEFLGRQGKIKEALDLLDQPEKKYSRLEIMDTLGNALRGSKKAPTPAEYERARKIAESYSAPSDNPVGVQLFMGQLFEIEGNYSAAISIYEDLLKLPDLSRAQKAFAQNNLAYVLAVTNTDVSRALDLVTDAIKNIGEEAGLLDTRATVYLRTNERSKIDAAIRDLERAVAIKQNELYYFHLAVAYLRKDDKISAKVALDIARQINMNLTQVIPLKERNDYGKLINALR